MPAASDGGGHHLPPTTLPVFPLTGMLLLPGNFMPLNIFEPRYRNMVEDALVGDGHIGMIQPLLPGPDSSGVGEENPQLYSVGCAGLLDQAERQDDGRFLIVLRGVMRFLVEAEIGQRRGYRRVRASYEAFGGDLRSRRDSTDTARLLAAVERFAHSRELEFDMDLLAALDHRRLVNALAAALPFAPAEQQALLEAGDSARRGAVLLELMRMGPESRGGGASFVPPTVN
jgi:Lon protease-like protein